MTLQIFQAFIDVIKTLRGPNGCPWDKMQTMASLIPFIIEEAYELVEAIEHNDYDHIKEELGDILLHVVMLANMAEETDQFSINDVIELEKAKMIGRHPHVFKDVKVTSISDVWQNWEAIKLKEKPEQKSVLDQIPKSLPSLLQAEKIQKKLSRLGFDWDSPVEPIKKLEEEVAEFKAEVLKQNQDLFAMEEEFGDILFSMVNIARKLNINAEVALKNANQKFIDRIKKIESNLSRENRKLTDLTLNEFDCYWEAVKL
ncbi:MAG: nucleoside triphosphate pyrophosphohydrolase [Candidatus Margulisiibacteriota bacterium]|jgi:MazG family protein